MTTQGYGPGNGETWSGRRSAGKHSLAPGGEGSPPTPVVVVSGGSQIHRAALNGPC